jgi:hypothetical protein
MTKSDDDEVLDAILKKQMPGFRRVQPAAQAQPPNPEAATPDLDILRSKGDSLTSAATTPRADDVASILKRRLGGGGRSNTSNGPLPAPAAGSPDDVVISPVRPDRDAKVDDPADAKGVVWSKSRKKILFRQG